MRNGTFLFTPHPSCFIPVCVAKLGNLLRSPGGQTDERQPVGTKRGLVAAWSFRRPKPCQFQQTVQFAVGKALFLGFVVNGEEVHQVVHDLDVCDDAPAAAFAPAFGGDGEADFEAVFAEAVP